MYRMGGGPVHQAFNEDFFLWLRCQIICIDDYAYAGVDFRGDPDMPLPEGAQFGDIGKTFTFLIFKLLNFYGFLKKLYDFFDMTSVLTKQCFHANVGKECPTGFPGTRRRAREVAPIDPSLVLHRVRRNLSELTLDVPAWEIEDIPEGIQRLVVGVPRPWIRLLSLPLPLCTMWRLGLHHLRMISLLGIYDSA